MLLKSLPLWPRDRECPGNGKAPVKFRVPVLWGWITIYTCRVQCFDNVNTWKFPALCGQKRTPLSKFLSAPPYQAERADLLMIG